MYCYLAPFYKEVIKAWYLLQEKRKKVQGVHRNDLLWANDHVRYKGKILFFIFASCHPLIYLHSMKK